MALKAKITAFDYGSLPEVLKAEYKLDHDGSYNLDLGGLFLTDRDPAGLMSALENERKEHSKTKSHADRLESEAKEAKRAVELAEAQKKGDLAELKKLFDEQRAEIEKSYQRQLEGERQARAKQQQQTAEEFKRAKALEIANDLFKNNAPIMLPHVLAGMKAVPGEQPAVEFVNPDGTPNLGATIDTFKQSFLTHPIFKSMVIVSQASGGSANDGTSKSVPYKKDGTVKSFDDYTSGELVELLASNPAEYERLKASRHSK